MRHLIDPEDYQELKGTNDAYDDERYFMGLNMLDITPMMIMAIPNIKRTMKGWILQNMTFMEGIGLSMT